MTDALQLFRQECETALTSALQKTFPEWAQTYPRLTIPPNLQFGELSSSVAHEIARKLGKSPSEVALQIKSALDLSGTRLVASLDEVSGYVNFKLDYAIASKMILEAVLTEKSEYGVVKVAEPIRISVEHTSANPSGPLTMGHARNSILGDVLARILKAQGHAVNRRFYVDDVGRQVSILAYGYKLLNRPKPIGKTDRWFGRLYACINCALQVETTKRKLKLIGDAPEKSEQRSELQRVLDEWVGVTAELAATDKELLDKVLKVVGSRPDPETDVQELGRNYEKNEKDASTLVREVANLCLEGIRTTLAGMEIEFDTWDWESQVLWDGQVEKAISRLMKLPFVKTEGKSASLDINSIVEAYSLRDAFHLSQNYEVPSLTLVRADGTSLYATRDIAYTLVKFLDSDRVINVIASEQTLPQLQIRLALYALGERRAAENLIHYAYGLVELPGEKMSKRRAHYIALDDVIEQAETKVRETMAGRKNELDEKVSEEITRTIALGAIRFSMLNVNSMKNFTFTWDRVLSLERNSSPFINYAYTRAGSILRKLGEIPSQADFSLLTHPLERLLIFRIGLLPGIFTEAADQLKPEDLASYANSLAEKFHEYYEKVDVIHSDEQVKNARAILVRAVQVAIRNSMWLLGIRVSERM